MVERDGMPGMAADSFSLRNVSVVIRKGWVAWKCCVIMPFADTAGEGGIVGVGYMCYYLNSVLCVFFALLPMHMMK